MTKSICRRSEQQGASSTGTIIGNRLPSAAAVYRYLVVDAPNATEAAQLLEAPGRPGQGTRSSRRLILAGGSRSGSARPLRSAAVSSLVDSPVFIAGW